MPDVEAKPPRLGRAGVVLDPHAAAEGQHTSVVQVFSGDKVLSPQPRELKRVERRADPSILDSFENDALGPLNDLNLGILGGKRKRGRVRSELAHLLSPRNGIDASYAWPRHRERTRCPLYRAAPYVSALPHFDLAPATARGA